MLKYVLADKDGNTAELHDNGLLVAVEQTPPMIPQRTKLFAQDFTDDGLVTGSNDLGVNGSATAVRYWIPASPTSDRYIGRLSILIGYGAAARPWEFADSGVILTNGVQFAYEDTEGDEVIIGSPQSNQALLRAGLAAGIIPTAWELRSLGATNDYGFIMAVDFSRIMSPYGVKLDAGTKQKLTITIQDDCTDADTFNARAFGFDRFP